MDSVTGYRRCSPAWVGGAADTFLLIGSTRFAEYDAKCEARDLTLGELMKPLAADDPRMIGEYRLRAQLGAGGMGRVYLGLSPAGRAVAIKVVHPDLASDADFLRRFGQEVAAARAVSGIYTAPVVASGLNERPPWLATAFVPGPPLDQVVAENGPLPEQALWPLLAGLVEALQAIHACGVVHRDLKPANVLLATDGPRVIDFGIARATDGTSLTAAGVVFGTPGYMSPEQAEGRGAGPASDVFALGCVVAYAAAGMGPFGTGTAAAILYRVVHAQPVLDGVPPRLRQVIAACLAKDPAARPSLRALSGMIAGGMDATGPSAVAFWPSSVARLIGAHQARLEEQTRSRPAEGFSWATTTHRPTTPSDPGRDRPAPPVQQPPAQQPPGQQAPAPRWPYSGPGGAQASLGAQAVPGSQAVGVQYPEPRGYLSGNGVPVAQAWLPAAVPGGIARCDGAAARQHGDRGPADVRRGGLRRDLGDRRHRGLGQHREALPAGQRVRRSPPGRGGDPGHPAVRRGHRAVARHRAGLPAGQQRRPGGGHGAVRGAHGGRARRGDQQPGGPRPGQGADPDRLADRPGRGDGPVAAPVQRLLHRPRAAQNR